MSTGEEQVASDMPQDEGGTEEDTGPTRAKVETVPCEICEEHPAKYKCPGCGKRTCSLPCVKAHKNDDGCRSATHLLACGDQCFPTAK